MSNYKSEWKPMALNKEFWEEVLVGRTIEKFTDNFKETFKHTDLRHDQKAYELLLDNGEKVWLSGETNYTGMVGGAKVVELTWDVQGIDDICLDNGTKIGMSKQGWRLCIEDTEDPNKEEVDRNAYADFLARFSTDVRSGEVKIANISQHRHFSRFYMGNKWTYFQDGMNELYLVHYNAKHLEEEVKRKAAYLEANPGAEGGTYEDHKCPECGKGRMMLPSKGPDVTKMATEPST